MMDQNERIICVKCGEVCGEIERIPTGQNGVWRNRAIPNPLPSLCPVCGGVVRRV